MIAAWMLWSIGAGLLFLVAGLAVERLLDGNRRWAWAAAGVGTVLLPAVRFLRGGGGGGGTEGAGPAGAVIALEPLAVTVAGDSVLRSLDAALLTGWVAASALLVLGALAGAARFAWRRRGWEDGSLLGRGVMWSRDTGPAVVGLATSRIVLPAWVAGAGRERQELVLAHEEEHVRAHDVRLRFLAALLLFAFPWNPALWIQYRRLCVAMELDCDRRVMHRWPGRRRLYGDLLLRVGTGGGKLPAMAVAALAERRSGLEQRIRTLFSKAPEVRMAQAAFLAFGAILVVGLAVIVPGIVNEEREGAEETESVSTETVPTFEVNIVPIPEASAEEAREAAAVEVARRVEELQAARRRVERDQRRRDRLESVEGDGPRWSDVDVRPVLLNRDDMALLLENEYPPLLRDAGIGGTATVWFFVDEAGKVAETQVHTSSGHEALDEAAMRVGEELTFSPAMNEGDPVKVWVTMNITFKTR